MLYQTGKAPNKIPFIIIGTELVLGTYTLRFYCTFWSSGLVGATSAPTVFSFSHENPSPGQSTLPRR